MKVKIKKVHADAKIPERKSKAAAGFDIYSIEETVIKPGESAMIRTGVALEFPEDVLVIVAPRSSFALKKNLDVPHSIGIGDSDYRGEYLLPLRNLGKEDAIIEKHERIGQFVFLYKLDIEFEEVDELEDTERGTGGFGSTGKF